MLLNNLIPGTFIKRYKRFFVDVKLQSGEIVTAHTNNTGSMASLLNPNCLVWLENSENPKRKLKYTLHLMQVPSGGYACVNTIIPNKLIYEAIEKRQIPAFENHQLLKREVPYGNKNSRIDIYLEQEKQPTFIEIKNVTLVEEALPTIAQFPDAPTERGRKHLNELAYEAQNGHRAVMFYLVNRTDCNGFKIAEHIDPEYARIFNDIIIKGVEIMVYQTTIEISGNAATLTIDSLN